MKKFFALVVAIGMLIGSGGIALAFDDPDDRGVKVRSLMKGGRNSDAAKIYLLVRNGDTRVNTASLNSGDVVVWDTNSADGVTVRTTTTTADGAIAGVLVTAIQTGDAGATSARDDDGRRNWGYMQVYGLTSAGIAAGGSNGAAVGEAFIASGDAGKVTTIEAVTAGDPDETQVRAIGNRGGFFMSTASDVSDTVVEVFVNTL